jgi:hypothetical protein
MNIPFRLDEGVYFENTDTLLCWGSSIETIMTLDNPEITENGKVLKWFDKSCFGGNRVNVTILISENTDGKLEFVCFEQGRNNPRVVFEKYSNLFKQVLGTPTETSNESYGRSTVLWTVNDLQIIIGVAERFVEYEIFGIHKGKPFWKLV